MKEFKKLGYAIETELKDDYLIRANIITVSKKEKKYDVSFEIRRKDIGKWDMINEEHYSIIADPYTQNTKVLELIEEKDKEKFFDYFIKRYEIELECSRVGFDKYIKAGE